jgi:hypothetical protein
MQNILRVALPGYNALSDTEPDHYALLSDQNDILIKELIRGSVSQATGGHTTITHGLGYIPYVVVFYEESAGVWRKISGNDVFNGTNVYIEVTSTTLTIYNFSGSTRNYKYYIFYDTITGTSNNTINLSKTRLAVGQSGADALNSKDPNDFIFHSDLNTFKIVSTGIYTNSIAGSTTTIFSFAHGLSYVPLVQGFLKLDNYSFACAPNCEIYSIFATKTQLYAARFNYIQADDTNIYFSITNYDGSANPFAIRYYIYEVPIG